MKKAIIYVSFQIFAFITLLLVSGLFDGVLGSVVYYLAFLLPFFAVILFVKRDNIPFTPTKIKTSGKAVFLTVPLIAPTLLIILFASWLSSLAFDSDVATNVSGNLILVVITAVLVPSVLEEAFFRYLPLAILTPYSKKTAIFISAFGFALVHFNPYQIAYAFVAGVIFAAVDIAFNSILPSLIFHFTNNLASVLLLRYSAENLFNLTYILILSAVAVLSIFVIYVWKNKYITEIRRVYKTRG